MTLRKLMLLSGLCALMPASLPATPPPLPAFPPLVFHPPKPERFVLPNGLVVFLLEDHELPLIRLDVLVKAGSQYDPPDKVGLSDLFGPVMTDGGSQHHSSEDIRRTLDVTGSGISFGVSLEQANGGLTCRTEDFDRLFAIFTDLLLAPEFRNDFVNLEKDKTQEALRRMNDDPSDIARREFRHAVYGSTHPYARSPEPRSIDRIRRRDFQAMHALYFKPNVSLLAVSGDFQSAAMKQKIQAALGTWARTEVSYPPVPRVVPTRESAVYYVQRAIDQTQIRIGHTGLARHDPDHFAWEVFNELWGGSATSRLFRIVRTQKGLAYQVGSVFTEPADLGLIVAISLTRGGETIQAIRSMQEIARDVRQAPFSQQEVHFAKESIRNRFVENFTSSAQIANEVLGFEFQGYPKDYLDTYTDKIAKVTLTDLRRAAERHLHPDQSVLLVVGDLSTFEKPLSTIGRPREIRVPDYRLESMQP